MIKSAAGILVLCAASFCNAQSAVNATPLPTKHFRLTFVVTDPQGARPLQTLVLEVPVAPDRPGMSSIHQAAGFDGQAENSLEENLRCSNVRESATGVAATVSFAMHSISPASASGNEPQHQQITFERKVDLALGKPTKITEAMHLTPLRQGDPTPLSTQPAAPQITVTAEVM